MAHLPQTLEQLARIGANLDLSAQSNYLPQTLENLARLAEGSGGHVTISAHNMLPQTLEQIARVGRNHVTFRV